MRKPQANHWESATWNLQPATCNLQPVTQMDPLLAKIRAQLPSETLSFGLLVRGEVLNYRLSPN
jgi:hypothetical protein